MLLYEWPESRVIAALAHQADFDVCWCKGSVSERIFLPLVDKIKKAGAKIQGSTFVTDVITDATGKVSLYSITQKISLRKSQEEMDRGILLHIAVHDPSIQNFQISQRGKVSSITSCSDQSLSKGSPEEEVAL